METESKMTISEAIAELRQMERHYRAVAKIREVLLLASDYEAKLDDMRRKAEAAEDEATSALSRREAALSAAKDAESIASKEIEGAEETARFRIDKIRTECDKVVEVQKVHTEMAVAEYKSQATDWYERAEAAKAYYQQVVADLSEKENNLRASLREIAQAAKVAGDEPK